MLVVVVVVAGVVVVVGSLVVVVVVRLAVVVGLFVVVVDVVAVVAGGGSAGWVRLGSAVMADRESAPAEMVTPLRSAHVRQHNAFRTLGLEQSAVRQSYCFSSPCGQLAGRHRSIR